MKSSNNLYYAIAAVVVLLIGGYVVFQGKSGSTLPVAEVPFAPSATTTPVVKAAPPAQTTRPAASITVTQGGDVEIAFDATNLRVGSTISTITMTLPKGSNGKVLVLSLKPIGTSTTKEGILLATEVHPTSSTYSISGLKLSKMSDPSTGTKMSVVAGTYVIQAVLWDKSPFGPTGTYTNLAGNNGNGTQSPAFTISPAQ